jgi:hypothetical protein
MSALQANPFLMAGGDDGYVVERSLRFYDDNSAYLKRTMGTPTSSGTWTWSGWVKRSELGTNQAIASGFGGSIFSTFYFDTNDKLFFYDYNVEYTIDVRFRDVGAWYHICIAHSASSSITIYVNGAQVHQRTSNVPSVSRFNYSGGTANIGTRQTSSSGRSLYYHGYIAEVNFIDGQALGPTNFGEFDDFNVWQPLKYSGTYGNNGYYLNFSDNSSTSTIGADSSGNSNDFTSHNISVSSGAGNDSVLDSPTDNYCTLNESTYTQNQVQQTDGGLYFVNSSRNYPAMGTMLIPKSGKYYYEVTINSVGNINIGLANHQPIPDYGGPGFNIYYTRTTLKSYGYNLNGVYAGNSGNSLATGDVVGVAINADNSQISWYKNGSLIVSSKSFTNSNLVPYISQDTTSGSCGGTVNFGQQPFSYTVSGYKSLSTGNLPEPTIPDGSKYFDTKVWTGTGSTNSIATNFSPDFVWIKSRSDATYHKLYDIVRGVGKDLGSNRSDAEGYRNDTLTSFDSTGFTLGSDGQAPVNRSGRSYVGWAWDGGSSTVSNTDGSITSNVRAQPSAGFSIVSYSGSSSAVTVGHGLNAAPEMIIIKDRDSGVYNWQVAHISMNADDSLLLNKSDSKTDYNAWNNTRPTSTVFSLGAGTLGVNTNGNNMIAYCFAPVEGYSSFGRFEGTGEDLHGPYINCGFTPAFVMIKDTNDSNPWRIWDSGRELSNPKTYSLVPNSSGSETDNTNGDDVDFLSYGFRPAAGQNSGNGNGTHYIYAAFAEHPFKTARAR